MGVKSSQFGKEMEEALSRGKGFEKAFETASKKSKVKKLKAKKSKAKKSKKIKINKKETNWLRRKLAELYYGENMPISEKQKLLRKKFENKMKLYKKKNS